MATKYIFVTGGVISGIGKGVTTASIGLLLQSAGYRVSPMKMEMYFNMDAGTLNPQEHGEVFVTADGLETDLDLGNYERFLDIQLNRANYSTSGMLYKHILDKERRHGFNGDTVQPIPHITNEIIHRIKQAGQAHQADIVMVELGGTVGDYENVLYLEASRIMKLRAPQDVIQIHLGYLPIPGTLGEMKSKPIQQSVRALNSMGIQPDMIIGRSTDSIDKTRRQKISLFTNVEPQDVISNPDVESIYQIPLVLDKQQVAERLLGKLDLPVKQKDLAKWKKLNATINSVNQEITIGIVGKDFASGDYVIEDVYTSVNEAIKYAAWSQQLKPKLMSISAQEVAQGHMTALQQVQAIVVPNSLGAADSVGLIKAIEYAREQQIPFLGIGAGLQLAVIEFAQHVLGLHQASAIEINPNTPDPVIVPVSSRHKSTTESVDVPLCLGQYTCHLQDNTLTKDCYQQAKVEERHRHSGEINTEYAQQFNQAGLVISGSSPNGQIIEAMELRPSLHPFFIGTQFQPELSTRPTAAHPLFIGLIQAATQKGKK